MINLLRKSHPSPIGYGCNNPLTPVGSEAGTAIGWHCPRCGQALDLPEELGTLVRAAGQKIADINQDFAEPELLEEARRIAEEALAVLRQEDAPQVSAQVDGLVRLIAEAAARRWRSIRTAAVFRTARLGLR